MRAGSLRLLPLLLLAAVAIAGYALSQQPETGPGASEQRTTNSGVVIETANFRITSTATPDQAARVGEVMQALHRAYSDFFPGGVAVPSRTGKLALRLYRNRDEFQANNRSRPWTEAYYLDGTSHAYFAQDRPNPHHWMVHEGTHQLIREVSGWRPPPWVNEGLATYFGASRIDRDEMVPGAVDGGAYPVWWLDDLGLSGDLAADIAAGRIIPLRALVEGGGPPIESALNLYYVEYWSLSHFLFHHDGGKHAVAYRKLIAEGGSSVADFERAFGPIDTLQQAWFGHLLELAETGARTP